MAIVGFIANGRVRYAVLATYVDGVSQNAEEQSVAWAFRHLLRKHTSLALTQNKAISSTT